MIKIDCRNGNVYAEHETEEDSTFFPVQNVLRFLEHRIEFLNPQFFSLRTIHFMLKKFPELCQLSRHAEEFLTLAEDAIPRMGIANEPDDDQVISLIIHKKTQIERSELTLDNVKMNHNLTKIVPTYKDQPSCSIFKSVDILGQTPTGETGIGLLNLKDLYHLRIDVRNAVIHDTYAAANEDRTDVVAESEYIYEQENHDITLSELLDSVYVSIDLFDPEENQELLDRVRERKESMNNNNENGKETHD